MELLKAEIFALTRKVEAIHAIVERLNDKISDHILAEQTHKYQSSESDSHLLEITQINEIKQKYNCLASELEHKDVLLDDNSFNKSNQNIDGELTSEIQIQRLTAQLTAAYNRIAALEEQLLSKRVKH
ncbi:MAG: hypothetical protein AB4080_18120 [Trichodesmium sp.]